jgi:hypothetical protein
MIVHPCRSNLEASQELEYVIDQRPCPEWKAMLSRFWSGRFRCVFPSSRENGGGNGHVGLIEAFGIVRYLDENL